jgi:hypothetical protein
MTNAKFRFTSRRTLFVREHAISFFAIGWLVLMTHFAAAAPAVLVENGKPRFTIVTGENPNPSTNDAVQELNYWIEKITSATLPVTTTAHWDGSTPIIAVGSSEITQRNGWEKTPFQQEEARIFIEENRIGLLGNDNAPYPGITWTGTYYAVLELVQKEFGVRWIWPGKSGEVFTRRKTLSLPEKSWSWAPAITKIRQLRNGYNSTATPGNLKTELGIDFQSNGQWQQLRDEHELWLKRERMNISSNIRFGHAFRDWWDKYSKAHLDWFAKPPGDLTQRGGKGVKLNISNPEVHDQIIGDWKAAWEKNPSANKFLNVSPNDSRGFDTRPETRAWDPPELSRFSDKEIYNGDEPILSDRYVKLWNLLAKRVREIDPEAQLATYAYRNYQKPPLAEKKVESNIVVGYVGGEGYYPDERSITGEWHEWADKGAQLVWRPNLFHTGHGTPYAYSKALYDDFHFFQNNNLIGFDFDTLTGNWAGQGLAYYVLAEMSSRPNASYEELSREYFESFGPAADSIREYSRYFETLTRNAPQLLRDHDLVSHHTWGGWWPAHIRLVPLFLTPAVAAHAEKILQHAARQVETAEPIYQERLSTIRKGFEHSKIMAETFRKLQLDNPKIKMSYRDKQEILQPLWDYRHTILTDISVSTAALFAHEQRIFKLWDAFAPQEIAQNRQRDLPNTKTIALMQNWQFRIDPADKGVQARWFSPVNADSQWTSITIARPWREALKNTPESKIGWYRLSFEVPNLSDTGEKVLLRFGAIDSETRMWVNGVQVNERGYPHDGNYDSWNEAFEVDVTHAVQTAAKNDLVIRVESEQKNAGITGTVALLFKD